MAVKGGGSKRFFRPVLYSCEDLGRDFQAGYQGGRGYLTCVGILIADANNVVYGWQQGGEIGIRRRISLRKKPNILGIDIDLDLVSDPTLIENHHRKYHIVQSINMNDIVSWTKGRLYSIGEVDAAGLYKGLSEWFNVDED